MRHEYVERETGRVRHEVFYQDQTVRFLYHQARETLPIVFRLLTGARASQMIGYLNYDNKISSLSCSRFIGRHGIDLNECLNDQPFDTLRRLFERKIKYWQYRPMPQDPGVVVSPADARVLLGSFSESSHLFIKDKFFNYEELFSSDKTEWLRAFRGGDFAILRLTPEKYHYNHLPVSGIVEDIYEIRGAYHSCNPSAVVEMVTPYSKNTRVVTVINTEIGGGSKIGLVAMIEVVALMIGDIAQCYSAEYYDDPAPVYPGLLVAKGCPKSLFRPGSSTTLVVFQKHRVRFADDLLRNQSLPHALSRFSLPFGKTMIETDVKVRSAIAFRRSSR